MHTIAQPRLGHHARDAARAARAELMELDEALRTNEHDWRVLIGALSAAQINWRPARDRWSVSEHLAHLNIVDASYLPHLAGARRACSLAESHATHGSARCSSAASSRRCGSGCGRHTPTFHRRSWMRRRRWRSSLRCELPCASESHVPTGSIQGVYARDT